MKRRKFKLFASMASLVMVVAVMAVGVWAASTLTLNVTTNVAFTATGFVAKLDSKYKLGTAADVTNTQQDIAANTTTLNNWTIATTLDLCGSTGAPQDLTFTFTLSAVTLPAGKTLTITPSFTTTPSGFTAAENVYSHTNGLKVTFTSGTYTSGTVSATILVQYDGTATNSVASTALPFTVTMAAA